MSYEKVCSVIAETLGCDVENVKTESTLKDLGADSLASVELMMALEEATGVSIEDDAIADLQTVGDIMTYLEKNAA